MDITANEGQRMRRAEAEADVTANEGQRIQRAEAEDGKEREISHGIEITSSIRIALVESVRSSLWYSMSHTGAIGGKSYDAHHLPRT